MVFRLQSAPAEKLSRFVNAENMIRRRINLISGGTPGQLNDLKVASNALSVTDVGANRVSRQRNLHILHVRLIQRLEQLLGMGVHINLFFEIIPDGWLECAKESYFIPNQEWIRDDVLRNIDRCKAVLCKTRYAESIFSKRGFNAKYVGFTSCDYFDSGVDKDYNGFIHVAGRSHLKGTRVLLDLWRENPQWPKLLLISRDPFHEQLISANVELRSDFIPESEYIYLINKYGIHLCPSETEGFGHYIGEALACQSLVVTVDAPPMNELVSKEHGVLASFRDKEAMGFGERYYVDKTSLTECIESILKMPTAQRKMMGVKGGEKYSKMTLDFQKQLPLALG